MTNRLLGSLILAIFCVSTAGATTIPCSLTSGVDPAVNTAPPGTTPNPTLTNVTWTCSAYTVPLGQTLTQVDIIIHNDYSLGSSDDTVVDFSDTISGFNTTSLKTFVSGGITSTSGGITTQTPGPNLCTATGTNSVDCEETGLHITSSFNAVTVTGNSSWVSGGVEPTGGVDFNVEEVVTLSSAPEPASLLTLGGGLAVLALLARRRRQQVRPSVS